MQISNNDFYSKVKDLMKKNEFFDEIKKIQNESNGLFDESISALLVVEKYGRNDDNKIKISNLESGMESTISGKITKIGDIREFKKQNGIRGRVVNLKIMDETGTCGLVLWDNDVNLIKNKIIEIGTYIKLINGNVKKGLDGIEINIGRWGLIEVIPNRNPTNIKLDYNKLISGQILEIQPSKAFFKNNGDYGFCTTIKIKDKNQIKKLIIWNEKVKEIQNFKPGDLIAFENVENKNNNGIKENHVDIHSIIKKI
jgi:hypothetical protein